MKLRETVCKVNEIIKSSLHDYTASAVFIHCTKVNMRKSNKLVMLYYSYTFHCYIKLQVTKLCLCIICILWGLCLLAESIVALTWACGFDSAACVDWMTSLDKNTFSYDSSRVEILHISTGMRVLGGITKYSWSKNEVWRAQSPWLDEYLENLKQHE